MLKPRVCLPYLPEFDTRSVVFQRKKPSFSEYQVVLRNVFRNFEIFLFPKVIYLKMITAICSLLAFQRGYVSREGSREEESASVGIFLGFGNF